MLDVLDLLAVTWQPLDLSLTVQDGQPDGDLQTFPVRAHF